MPVPEISITDDNRDEIDFRLKTWGAQVKGKFKTDGVEIDTTVFDLHRITKIPGTKIFNKPDEPGRPQRISSIISEEFPEPEQKLRDDFLSIPIDKPNKPNISKADFGKPHNQNRIFENCYLIRFLKEKNDTGVNCTHPVRLALSSLSLALGDLDNNLSFIEQVLGGNPGYSADITRYFLQQNKGKCLPYGCEAMRKLLSDYEDFEQDKCNCNLTPSFDPATGTIRKSSPVRFAYLMEADLEEVFKDLEFNETDSFKNFLQLRSFTQNYLTCLDHSAAKVFLESKKKEWKLKKETISNLLSYRKQCIALAQQQEKIVEVTKDQKEEAIELLKRPSLLFDYGKFVQHQLGVVGEDQNIRIVLLSLTSRLLDKIISLIIKAESSSGKSYLLKKCLKIFPEEFYFEFTSMSDRAMFYTDKDFQHRFVIFYEFDGQNDEINYLIRTLQTEGRLKYETTEKVDGQFVTRCIDKEGPTGFFTTTTKPQIFDENETRIFSLFINESEEQTKKILKKLGDNFEQNGIDVPQQEIDAWKNIQRVLKPLKVKIPYACWLADNVPTNKVRIRRDFERILVSIAVCALLHQFQREQVEKDGQKYVIASIIDYLMVRELLEGTLIKTVKETSPKTDVIIKAIREIYQAKKDDDPKTEADELVSIAEIMKDTKFARRTIYKWIDPAINNDFIEKKHFGKYVYFKPLKEEDEEYIFLPEPEKIFNELPELSKDIRFVNPITGEELRVNDDGK